jgi:hypothetical protein
VAVELSGAVEAVEQGGAGEPTAVLDVPAGSPEASHGVAPAAAPPADYRDALARIVRTAEAGEHTRAAELALTLEQVAVAADGPAAEAVLMVRQVRAHLARLAGDPVAAAELYHEVAVALLAGRGAQDGQVQQVATNAEACWRAIPDPVRALELAPRILELRAQLPGPEGRKLRAAERYRAQLATAATAE